jgi:hypothetical protein
VRRICSCIVVALLLLIPAVTRGQSPLRARDPLHVYLITFGPGSDPWEKFGHDCIALKNDYDPANAVVYNWGVFDFGHGLSGYLTFGWHFLQGKLNYSMQADYEDHMLEEYKAAGRSILIQELNLTRPQKLELAARLAANDTDANRYYLYDYFKKNCTTMARDAIDQTVGGRIATTLKRVPGSTTYRWQDRRTTAGDLWLYIFLDYVLGHDVDRPLTAYDECFLPGTLAYYLNSVQVPAADGKLKPLVINKYVYAQGTIKDRQDPPDYFFVGFLGTGIGAGILFFVFGSMGIRFRIARWIFVLAVMLWSLLVGLLGVLSTFAWFTNHEAAKWNENWFQGNPISLLLIVAMPMVLRWPKFTRRTALVILGLSIFGLVAKLTPWFWQVNGQIIAAALPIHAGIAWGIYRLTTRKLAPIVPVENPTPEAVDAA